VYERVFGEDQIGISGSAIRLYGPAHLSKFYLCRKRRFPGDVFNVLRAVDVPRLSASLDAEFIEESEGWPVGDGPTRMLNMRGVLASADGDIVRSALEPILLKSLDQMQSAYAFVDYRRNQGELFE
jgi:hypothetical protein